MPRVYVIDPIPVEREGYAAILSRRAGFDIVGRAEGIERAEQELAGMGAVVVLLDAHLPTTTWRDACARVRRANARAAIVLVLTGVDGEAITTARSAAVGGVLSKSSPPVQIRRAVRAVAAGETFFELPPEAAPHSAPVERRAARPFGLTRQQLRVLELIPRGLSNRDIGAELHISEHTVKTHVTQILRKLRARDRAQAAVIALRKGLV